MSTLTFPSKYKPELAVSKDFTREVLMNPYLMWADGVARVVSTNGTFLVSLPVDCSDKNESGAISCDVIKLARQHRIDRSGDTTIELDEDYCTLPNGWKMPRIKEVNFPNIQQVIPEGPWPTRIAFNAKFLWDIARTMGVEVVTLEMKAPSSPFMIRPIDNTNTAFGVLMPCRHIEPK